MNQFWMVWCPTGRAPVVKHDTEESATCEAERLARANRGQEFYVLEAVRMRTTDDMRRVELRGNGGPDEIPF